MSQFVPDDSFDLLLTASLQARPLPGANLLLAEQILMRARQAELLGAARLRRVRWAQQAATLVAAGLLLAIALIGGGQLLLNAGVGNDATSIETSLAATEDAALGSSSATTQVAASFGLGLALLVTLLIGMHSALSPGNWPAGPARLHW
jgi:hypothetical protein